MNGAQFREVKMILAKNRFGQKLSPGDSRSFLPLLLSVLFLCMKAANNLLYLSVLTIFLEKAGANSLPWVYLVVNACFIFIQFRFITRIAGYEGHWLLRKINPPFVAMPFLAAFILPAESNVLLIAFLVAAMLSDLVSNQAFTAMLNHFLSLSEAKKVLPFVFAAGSLGYILSGLTLKFVIDVVGFKGLLMLNGCIALMASMLITRLRIFEDKRLSESRDEACASEKAESLKIQKSLEHPLAKLLIYSSFLVIFNRYLVDFLFASAVSSFFANGKDLASFMGVFGAAADLLVIGLQTFVMKVVFSSLPVGLVLTFVPAVLTFLCLSASISMKFSIIAAVQFLVMVNSKNFTIPATTMLMGVIPQKNRVLYRRDMSIACALASTLVGIFLLAVRSFLDPSSLFFLAASFYLILALVHLAIDRAYLNTLKDQIVSGEDRDEESVASVRYLNKKDRVEQLQILLNHENPETRILAIRETGELPAGEVAELLNEHLKTEKDSLCIAEIARILVTRCGNAAFRSLENIIEATEDYRLKADLIEAVGKLRGPGEDMILRHLEHFHHRVKAGSIISLLRTARSRETLEIALGQLAAMVRDGTQMMRSSAAAVMGELGLPLFLPCLEQLAFETDDSVAISAVNAIARIQTPASFTILERVKRNGSDQASLIAMKLVEGAARNGFEQIGRLITSVTAEERLQLATRIRKMTDDESYELLSVVLCIEEVDTRKKLVKLFERANPEILELMSRCVILSANGRVILTLAPAFSLVIDEFYFETPSWINLVRAIGGGSLENPDSSFMPGMRQFLATIWAENIAAAKLELLPDKLEKLFQRNRVAAEMLCFLSSEPASLIDSIEAIVAGNPNSCSLATEFLENRLGRKNSEMLIPLLEVCRGEREELRQLVQKSRQLKPEISDCLLEMAEIRVKKKLS